MTKKWYQGHIEPWWDDSFKSLDYKSRPLTSQDDEKKWIEQGHGYFRNLNGMDYNMKDGMPEYAMRFLTLFDWKDQGLVYFKMLQGDALPEHQDQYIYYRKLFHIEDPNQIFRCIIFLEDWKSGHYFEIDKHCISNWRQGDYVCWNNDVPHAAANIGTEPRYTIQITGTQK